MSDTATIVHEIETAYAAYAGSFNDENIDGVVRYISAPYVMTIGANAPMIMDTPAHVRGLFEKSLAGMKGRGWAKSDFKTVQIWPLSDGHALLMTDITRYKGDGSVLEKGRYIYSVRRADPSWQITAVTDVAPPYTGPGDHPRT